MPYQRWWKNVTNNSHLIIVMLAQDASETLQQEIRQCLTTVPHHSNTSLSNRLFPVVNHLVVVGTEPRITYHRQPSTNDCQCWLAVNMSENSRVHRLYIHQLLTSLSFAWHREKPMSLTDCPSFLPATQQNIPEVWDCCLCFALFFRLLGHCLSTRFILLQTQHTGLWWLTFRAVSDGLTFAFLPLQ